METPALPSFPGSSFMILSVSIVGILATSLLLLTYYLFLTKCGFASWRRDHDRDVAAQPHRMSVYYTPAAEQARGLEEAAIRRIPTFRYRKQVASDCAVCLSEFEEGERLRLLPPCLHAFHIDCIDAWLHATANCPLCRAAVSDSAAACPPHIVAVLQFQADDVVANANSVVIDIASPEGMGGGGDVVGGASEHDVAARKQQLRSNGSSSSSKIIMGDECIDLRRSDGELLGVQQQPMRRSLSMDSCNDKHLFLALHKILQQQQQHSALVGEGDGKEGESSTAGGGGGSRAGRLRRSFFSFSQSRSSRSAILPI